MLRRRVLFVVYFSSSAVDMRENGLSLSLYVTRIMEGKPQSAMASIFNEAFYIEILSSRMRSHLMTISLSLIIALQSNQLRC